MYQLAVTVMAISLAAVAVAGGAGYLSSDIGNRRKVEIEVSGSLAVMGAAVSSYRTANAGLVPRTGGDAWRGELAPYLPHGRVPDTSGLGWRYLERDGSPVFCLASDGPMVPSALRGVRQATRGTGGVGLFSGCSSAEPAASEGGGTVAVVMRAGD